jgi:peptidoglycan biosynthesis protein MviN/MurJ (putative lipid II flippase)
MHFIRSNIPVPIIFASIGVVVFGLTDLFTARLMSHFISGIGKAALASAFEGGVLGYLVGWYAVKKKWPRLQRHALRCGGRI